MEPVTSQESALDGQGGTLEVSVWRGTSQGGGYQRFEVPALENQTILDVVSWIQQYADATLTYRFACRVGMCGSCAMMVNGQPRWTCRTHVKKVLKAGKVQIGPLRNLPVIKDLAADMDPFFDKWVAAGGAHAPSATRDDPIPPVDPEDAIRVEASAGIECINCSICYAACDTVAGNPDYLGPAALQRAWTLLNDAKHDARDQILDAVSGAGGCHNCHSMGSCTTFCPNDLDPMSAIAGLKRETTRAFLRKGRR
ncbi:succinate dehydrogenase/fumarate reductase iron-sulfur subunit [Roseobacter sp.]|uniref:succinate dehydrogenase/fumarate reductase iron-sulfur subunit n=1 Tax=Roseobacter sp. TaxID=1907202 RepID=UPI002966B4BD|nr:2Fe-2S iron-sulfur cluster-binding protein [Roseobacter sp.]MDW3182015.1 2Fe-2S iron-sulfur cluster-binding protein [Roseobacter sp.]